MVVPPRLGFCVIEVCLSCYNNNVKLYSITIIVHYNVNQVSINSVGLVGIIKLVMSGARRDRCQCLLSLPIACIEFDHFKTT